MPDLAAAYAEQEVNLESRNWATAIKLACEEVSKRPHVLGRHIKSAKITFTVMDAANPASSKSRQLQPDSGKNAQGLLFDL